MSERRNNTAVFDAAVYKRNKIRTEQVDKYLKGGKCFIDPASIRSQLVDAANPEASVVRDVIEKSLAIETLTPLETALLLNVDDPELLAEMREAAGKVKRDVYDNRIVTFAPLYLSNRCVNDCVYCGLRRSNRAIERRTLSMEQVRRETEILTGEIGHKRLIVVYGEHPETDVQYMAKTLQTIGDVEVRGRCGPSRIRRCNVNAAPMSVEELKVLEDVGIGTFQVFQETYHRPAYERVHPKNTLKGDYLWRLYSMHRAMEAGVDDVGIGALFGLYDWKFEVMALLHHARELEDKFGVGPHTISFPRLEAAANTPFVDDLDYAVSNDEFEKLVTVIRLAVPYTGMILTAREDADARRRVLPLGCTQIDAGTKIGVGAYSESGEDPECCTQQFTIGDARSLDEVVRELAEQGFITSFCTAGYRCGRTGTRIMEMLKCGKEGNLCKLNAVLTFREWLDDFASEQTRAVGEKVIAAEIAEIREQLPGAYEAFMKLYEKTRVGQRDLYF